MKKIVISIIVIIVIALTAFGVWYYGENLVNKIEVLNDEINISYYNFRGNEDYTDYQYYNFGGIRLYKDGSIAFVSDLAMCSNEELYRKIEQEKWTQEEIESAIKPNPILYENSENVIINNIYNIYTMFKEKEKGYYFYILDKENYLYVFQVTNSNFGYFNVSKVSEKKVYSINIIKGEVNDKYKTCQMTIEVLYEDRTIENISGFRNLFYI